MRRVSGLRRFLAVPFGLALVVTTGWSNTVEFDKLPEPVAKTFKAVFPSGVVEKLTSAEENGTTVYDFEFRSGDREMETDIIADGTMVESTLVIVAADIPAPAMKVIQKAAKGATLGRLEWISTNSEIEKGKAVRLPKPVIKYAAEMTRGDQMAEIILTATGKVLEPPVWAPIAPAAAPAGGGTAK
jgi:hypothetical protein